MISDAELHEPKQGGDITFMDMIDEAEARGESQIQKFLSGSTILVTGGTGFLGKLLVEKLLRTCPDIKKIYLLARPKKNKEIQKRLQEQFDDPLYERLRKQVPDFMSKIGVVEGDVGKVGLGISESDRQTVIDEVDVIFHGAATLRFNEPLRDAVFINVRGTREMMLLARACTKLKAMVHISTAYSNCTLSEIDEVFYESPIPGDKLIDLAESLDEKTINSITPGLIGDFPNTYAYTKGVAEDVLQKYSQGLPVAVVRPSIVIGTAKDPVAGWIDNVYGPTGVIVGAELGLLHVLHASPNASASLVPGDAVAAACVAAAWSVSRAENHQAPARDAPPLYHCVCSEKAPITWSKFMSLAETHGLSVPPMQAMWYYMLTLTNSKAMYTFLALLMHWIPAYIIDGVCMILGKKPQLRKAYTKIEQFAAVIEFFALREWRFHNNNMTRLYNELCDADKHIYDFDTSAIDWNEFLANYMKGIRVYLLKDPVTTIPESLKRHKRLKWLHYALLTVLSLLVLRLLWFFVSFLF
ncbi:fatty acyl-CoA reductase wat-like isoform X1 [Cydia fagiglandana]|uniref:fatty acyl-CoA reductase wat-like isoform X1 n=1 Tax=Cydia fagiglandana TaxID=1458189 RepID=UPI002FEDEC2C